MACVSSVGLAAAFLSAGSDFFTITDGLPASTSGNFSPSSRLIPRSVISFKDIPAGTILQRIRCESALQRGSSNPKNGRAMTPGNRSAFRDAMSQTQRPGSPPSSE